jgi:hypothetical protein
MPISMKMAKRQNLSLNPSKISGQCGRLMCCLSYENDMYVLEKKARQQQLPQAPAPVADESDADLAELEPNLRDEVDLRTETPVPLVEHGDLDESPVGVAPAPGAEGDRPNRRRRRRRRKPAGGQGGSSPAE